MTLMFINLLFGCKTSVAVHDDGNRVWDLARFEDLDEQALVPLHLIMDYNIIN